MAYSERARPTTHRVRIRWVRVLFLAAIVAAIAAAAGHQSPGSSSSPVSPAAHPPAPSPTPLASPVEVPPREPGGALGEADGAVPDDTTVFDDGVPGVARLDPLLLAALRRAATDAARDGIAFHVDSGWRSPAYQRRLLEDAIATYGSQQEAARWVATPTTSAHVSGEAVDLGRDAAAWLSERGAAYGLCQVYDNEAWHYELRPDAVHAGCPPTYADPTHDPRMQP